MSEGGRVVYEVLGLEKKEAKLSPFGVEYLRQYINARFAPQDHARQMEFIKYLTESWPEATKAYLKAHDLRDSAPRAEATEEQVSMFLFRVGQGISAEVETFLARLGEQARRHAAKRGRKR
jgi:hypothetical protein